jgi:predicted TIM-barrel fold metal-dependent hydrolase
MKKKLTVGFSTLLGIFFVLLTVRLILFTGPVKTPELLPLKKTILDFHGHTAGLGAGNSGNFISQAIRDSFKYDLYLKSFWTNERELKKQGDALILKNLSEHLKQSIYVNRAIILALDGVINNQGELDYEKTEVYIDNDFLGNELKKYDNLFFGASINPYRPDALSRLEKVKGQGAKLIKWLPSIQFIDPQDPKIKPFYEKLVELNLPLLVHTGDERSFTHAKDEFSDPMRLKFPLDLGVTVIAAHAASTGSRNGMTNMERLASLIPRYPNLYVDISSLTQINRLGALNKVLKDKRFEARILYGSDMPLINMKALVAPFYFPLNLTFKQMVRIARIENPWDRDVALKQALGLPKEVFDRPQELLKRFQD